MIQFALRCALLASVVATFGLTAAQAGIVGPTPLLRWTFDEESGDAIDTGSGLPANGVLGAAAVRSTDTPSGTGMSINLCGGAPCTIDEPGAGGIDGEVRATGAAQQKLDDLDQLTLTTWMKVTGINEEQGGSSNIRLLSKQTSGSFDGFSWNAVAPWRNSGSFPDECGEGFPDACEMIPDQFLPGLFVGGDNGLLPSFYPDDDIEGRGDEWIFVAVSYDGLSNVDNLKYYLGDTTGAVEQFSNSVSNDSGPVFDTGTFADFGIGFTDGAPEVDFSLPGFQDDVRVYGEILTAAQLDVVRLENVGDSLIVGDMNGDGVVNFGDLTPFTLGLTDVPAYDAAFPELADTRVQRGDANLDTAFNFGDLTPFVDLLTGGGASGSAVPEPSAAALASVLIALVGLARRRSA